MGVETEIKPEVKPEVKPEIKPESNLITRVSGFKKEESLSTDTKSAIDKQVAEPEFDFKEIEKITDPTAKEYAEKAYKSFQKGFNQKFQEIAEIRKTLEKQLQDNTGWTSEKIQGLLNNPEFVKAAYQVAQMQAPGTFEGTQDEWSSLSEGDKAKFKQLENKIVQLEQQGYQTQLRQQDEQLKQKFSNYKPEAVDILTAELLAGKVQATREHLWKVYDYDEAVQRAYDLGKQDKGQETREKADAISYDGVRTIANDSKLTPEKGESNLSFWNRSVANAMNKLKGEVKK